MVDGSSSPNELKSDSTPLFLYGEAQTHDILARSGVIDDEVVHLDRDYLVVANV